MNRGEAIILYRDIARQILRAVEYGPDGHWANRWQDTIRQEEKAHRRMAYRHRPRRKLTIEGAVAYFVVATFMEALRLERIGEPYGGWRFLDTRRDYQIAIGLVARNPALLETLAPERERDALRALEEWDYSRLV